MNNTIFKTDVTTRNIKTIYDQVKFNDIDLNPFYQREVVWNEQKQGNFINSCYRGIVPTPLIFNSNIDKTTCIDGKQRITSIINFFENKLWFEYNGYKIYYSAIPDEFENNDDYRVLTDDEKLELQQRSIPVIEYKKLKYEDEIDIFNRIQNGVVLSRDHFNHDFKDINIGKKLLELCDTKKELFENYRNSKRNEHQHFIICTMYIIDKNDLAEPSKPIKETYLNSFKTYDDLIKSFDKIDKLLDFIFGGNLLCHKSVPKMNKNILYTFIYFMNKKYKAPYVMSDDHSREIRNMLRQINKTCKDNYIGAKCSDKILLRINKLFQTEYNKIQFDTEKNEPVNNQKLKPTNESNPGPEFIDEESVSDDHIKENKQIFDDDINDSDAEEIEDQYKKSMNKEKEKEKKKKKTSIKHGSSSRKNNSGNKHKTK